MEVRELREGESGQVQELIRECGPYVVPYNVYAYWMLENYYASTCKVAVDNNRMIGFVSGMPNIDKGLLFIWQICVHKDYRGRGIAALLMDSLLMTAKEHGFKKFELSISEGNNASLNLFRSFSDKNDLSMVEKKRCAFGDVAEIVYEISLV
jgi:L-2,4-diaminobutyric acid acetyltransferase